MPTPGNDDIERGQPTERTSLLSNGSVNGDSRQPTSESTDINGAPRPRRQSEAGRSVFSQSEDITPENLGWPLYLYKKMMIVVRSNYVNWLMVFVPLGIMSAELGWGDTAIFILNFLAIIPLAALLSFATEELALQVGQTLGGLLNATFGNAVELIVCFRLGIPMYFCGSILT